MSSGIYQIQNTLNDKCYIGSAMDLQKRWMGHLNDLYHERHHNRYLQRVFDKYGEEAFTFIVLEYVEEPETLIEREQYYLNILNPEYNLAPTAGSQLGMRRTDETRAKMSRAHRGKHLSIETKKKISKSLLGNQRNRNKSHSEETKRKISASMIGKHLSVETKRKLSKAMIGNQNHNKPHSEEAKRKIGDAQRGERNHNYGKHPNAEARRKMSEAHKIYWQRVHEDKN